MCLLPDDRNVEEWQFLRGQQGEEFSFCRIEGYQLKAIRDCDKCSQFLSDECAVCVLSNGDEIEVTRLMNLSFGSAECGDNLCDFTEDYSECPKDCPSGSLDGYCDGIVDGICDLDCLEQDEEDEDCKGILDSDNFIEGRSLIDGDFNASVVGTTFAYSKGVEIGDYLEVAGKQILVVGIFNTGSFIDASIFMTLDMVRTFRVTYTESTISTILIKPVDRVGGGQIIQYINENLMDELNIEASDFEEMAEQGRQFIEITADFALNIGIISIIIGSLSVFNAILMSVMERKREIAVLKALGWTDNEVGIEVFVESLIISFVGGIIGLLGGIGVAIYVTATSNFLDLDIVPFTLVKSYGFAVLLGIFGGLYPAIRAIQIDPIVDISG